MLHVPPWNAGTHETHKTPGTGGTHGTRFLTSFNVPERQNGMTKYKMYDPRVVLYDQNAISYDQTTSQYDPRAFFMNAIYDQIAFCMTKMHFI